MREHMAPTPGVCAILFSVRRARLMAFAHHNSCAQSLPVLVLALESPFPALLSSTTRPVVTQPRLRPLPGSISSRLSALASGMFSSRPRAGRHANLVHWQQRAIRILGESIVSPRSIRLARNQPLRRGATPSSPHGLTVGWPPAATLRRQTSRDTPRSTLPSHRTNSRRINRMSITPRLRRYKLQCPQVSQRHDIVRAIRRAVRPRRWRQAASCGAARVVASPARARTRRQVICSPPTR